MNMVSKVRIVFLLPKENSDVLSKKIPRRKFYFLSEVKMIKED